MTRLTPLLTSLKTLNITYSKQETLLSTPETLPTAEPATPQIGYTVQNSDLPALSIRCHRPIYVAMVFGAGKFVSAGYVYWRMKKNGVSVATGSYLVSANYYYTVQALFYDVKAGDLLELALWSNVSGSNWDYKAFQVQVTRLIILNTPRLMAPCIFAAVSPQPVLALGNPSVYATNVLYPFHDDRILPSLSGATTYTFLYPKDTNGMFRIYRGDYLNQNTALVITSSSYRPYYYQNYVPTQFKFRGLRTEGQL